jgi:cold-inducible RNA-binding protein
VEFNAFSSGENMETKLYVGNLAYSATENDLRTLFEQAGEIKSVNLITDRDTGRSKGFAFIEMSSQAEAEKAINLFNGTELHNRTLTVSLARAREEGGRGRGGRSDRRSGGGRPGGGPPRGGGGGGGRRR